MAKIYEFVPVGDASECVGVVRENLIPQPGASLIPAAAIVLLDGRTWNGLLT